jgi:serine/threonine-protein kinase
MPGQNGKYWSANWTTGFGFTAIFCLFAYWLATGFFYALEAYIYDRGILLTQAESNDRIAVIAIDDRSIQNIGRWPWSRNIIASLLDQLAEANTRVIASTILMSEPQLDPGLEQLAQLRNLIGELESSDQAGGGNADLGIALEALRARLDKSIEAIDYDRQLVDSVRRAGNIILPIEFRLGMALGNPDNPPPDYVSKNQLSEIGAGAKQQAGLPANAMSPPIAELGEAAMALGHLNLNLDRDGKLRSELLVLNYFGQLYPSLALSIAAKSLNMDHRDIRVHADGGVSLGGLFIGTLPDYSMLNFFYPDRGSRAAFSVDSFYDVWTGVIPADKFKGKIVLIGPTATGIGDFQSTPIDASTAPILILAHTVSSILQQHFVVRPDWAWVLEFSAIALIALYLGMVLPRLRAGTGALISLLLVMILMATEYSLLVLDAEWLRLGSPALLIISGHLVMTVRSFRITERLRFRADAEGAESNKMLGLAFQGQGQLDMAFEKFRRCPHDDSMMDLLYNLGLDFERKRQFNKAGAVYGHMASHDIEFRDIRERMQRSQQLEETMIFGAGKSAARDSLLIEGSGIQKPVLGRYEIEKEIGKGAMGVVYLGRDPKINRVVAIKTIPLADEFGEDEIDSAKERFFREAETAGRLNHPDIVTVYDAGEEHDLAYIAMEFLEGEHLNKYTAPENLLPVDTVLRIISRAADALHYAHEQNVVHRDIKPANIIYLAEKDELKITDFGIARLTDSHTTKTGIVLGTPSYMSPEQLEGKNVTGASDLFSLGVTLYQLLTGQLPFQSDSMTGLMYKIASADHSPVRTYRPELPQCLEDIISRALQKETDQRFENGAAMASALRQCQEQLGD